MVLASARTRGAAAAPSAAAAAAVAAAGDVDVEAMDVDVEVGEEGGGGAAALHERLVALVGAAGGGEGGGGVWREHSYARPAQPGAQRHLRVLLAPPAAGTTTATGGAIDVGAAQDELCVCVRSQLPSDDVDTDDEEGEDGGGGGEGGGGGGGEGAVEWEPAVLALAPSASHARLAAAALREVAALRLQRLAAPAQRHRRQEQLRAAARRLRVCVAPLWGALGAGRGAAAWLAAAVRGAAPPAERSLLAALLAELAGMAPRLAARLPPAAPPPPDPLAAVGPPRLLPDGGPWLAWLRVGGQARRFERRLRARLPLCPLAPAAPLAKAPPDVYCAQLLSEMRAKLDALLAEAQTRGASVVLGGCGAGAALAAALTAPPSSAAAATPAAPNASGPKGGTALRGLVLLAPPLHAADGPPLLGGGGMPRLLVCGAEGGRGAALEAACGSGGAAEGGGGGRLVLAEGCDRLLRLPSRRRLRLNLPQHALDAALTEEVARWVSEVCEETAEESSAAEEESTGATLAELASRQWREEIAVPPAPRPAAPVLLVPGADTEPAAAGAEVGAVKRAQPEGRVVSRGAAGTPLPLLPPRRLQGAGAGSAGGAGAAEGALAAADILQLPIVFADDPPRAATAPVEPKYTRVIVAKRGSVPPPRPPAAAATAGGAAPRALVVRRALRVLSRPRPGPQ